MRAPPLLGRQDAAWLLLMGTASLGAAGLAHSHLGLRLQPQTWMAWVAFLCLGPFVEEWALRANLLPELHRALRKLAWAAAPAQWVSNAAVSAVFAALHHGMVGPQAWLWFLPSWVLGMVWFRYRRLLICAGLHIWFNASLALVSFGWPMGALAQLHPAPAAFERHMPSLPPPPVSTHSLPTATSHWHGAQLHAEVLSIDGQWVLKVSRRSDGPIGRDAVAMRLLGGSAQSVLPDMHFQGPILHLRWSDPSGPHAVGSEWIEMWFDSRLSGWPLVTYQHEVRRPGEVSGVVASLVDAKARWHRRTEASQDKQETEGPLKALPLVVLADMPDHRDYSIEPLQPKVHR